MSRQIYISSDHNGNAARAYLVKHFPQIVDIGRPYDLKVDYVDEAQAMARMMRSGGSVGILICGTGTGMSIAANRFPWIRAAICTDRATAELCREHNDANVLVLGQWRTPLGQMDEIIRAFLETEHLGGRHTARLEKLKDLEVG